MTTLAGPASATNPVAALLDGRTRLHIHATAAVALVFVAVYGKLVCPFIDGIRLDDLLVNLAIVAAAQIGLREALVHLWPVPAGARSAARHGWLQAVVAWLAAGFVAAAVHALRYPDFPTGSHAKLLSSYWLLGAGILAQWEYLVLERRARAIDQRITVNHLERITRRILEGYFLFTLVPSSALMLMVARYRYEGLVLEGVEIEVAFLGGFSVLMALAVAWHYGEGLRADAEAVLDGTRRIQHGERGITLDTSRPDEFGEVAGGINSMCRELEAQNVRLQRQLAELEAMTSVSRAMSGIAAVDEVLDLILENARTVVHAEASSLLLRDGEVLRFHVTQGDAAADLASAEIAVGKGIIGTAAAEAASILVPDAYADPRFDRSFDERTGFRTRTLLTVPLCLKGAVTGVIQVINKAGDAAFDDDDRHLLESFAAQAAITLENARLYDETVQLANDLREALEQERRLTIEKEKLGAYIPKTVVDEISRNREAVLALGGRTVRATVLFSDITGFTRLSEGLDPQEVVRVLNRYMTAMSDAVEEHGGIIDKFMGDGIMAVFPPEDCPQHELAAVRAGLAMQQRLAKLREAWAGEHAEVSGLQMRVGINTGAMVAGNIGSATRMDYTVIGDEVNVASRIEGACTPGEVLASAATLAALPAETVTGETVKLTVKNREAPVAARVVKRVPAA